MSDTDSWRGDATRCVVMCGGRGTRFGSTDTHKSHSEINGQPLIHHVISYWQDFTDDFIFVVKHGKQPLMEYISHLPIKSEFVEPDRLQGIANGLACVEPMISDRFIVVLGDCFCAGEFALPPSFDYGIGVLPGAAPEQLRRNYAVFVDDEDRVTAVEEKPTDLRSDLCGLGYYFFQPEIFDYIRETPFSVRTGAHEITDVLQTLVNAGIDLRALRLDGSYVNVTYPEDLSVVRQVLGVDG